jgi:hypothetical protein
MNLKNSGEEMFTRKRAHLKAIHIKNNFPSFNDESHSLSLCVLKVLHRKT